MSSVAIRGLDEGRSIPRSAVAGMSAKLKGKLLEPDAPGYDEARAIWNAMIDRRPGLIVSCASADDVVAAVRFACKHELLVAVRGGGHNIAGNAVCDGGLQINLSALKAVRVDARARTASVEPGATLADVDRETQKHGLALPVGINSTTGIAGLALGGGFGWTSRKFGLTVDNLVAADIVTADGRLRRVDAQNEPDLFWAIRGGGGNFGVVTTFEFRLHPVGPEVWAGLIVHPIANARAVLQHYRDFCSSAPDELTTWVVMRQAPALPFLPVDVHGTEVCILAVCYLGDADAGARALAPLRQYGSPIAEAIGPTPFTAWEASFDPLLTPGARNYWKSVDFAELSDGAIDAMLDGVASLPDAQCEVFIPQLGGAIARVAADATAYTFRSAPFGMNVHARWSDPQKDELCVAWARRVFQNVRPYASEGVYINFMTEEESERVQPAYGSNYDRLVEIKNRYDPLNLFRMNQNIRPSR
jgi:FAD/FMN-containing dehydrogenase